jgi:hypothetical protein
VVAEAEAQQVPLLRLAQAGHLIFQPEAVEEVVLLLLQLRESLNWAVLVDQLAVRQPQVVVVRQVHQ